MQNTWMLIGVLVLTLLGVVLFLSIIFGFKNKLQRSSQQKTVLCISVPKELEIGPIAAEQIFSTVHGIYRKMSFWKRLLGFRQESVSFEIANADKSIRFFICFPTRFRNTIESQVYAQYPDAEIFEVEDYAAKNLSHFKNAIGAELGFTDADIFPIKRYTQFEDKLAKIAVDPIAGITSTLTKFDDPKDQAWIQIVVSPMSEKWRIHLIKCVKLVSKGFLMSFEWYHNAYARAFITRKIWTKIVFFPLYLYFGVRGIMIRSGISSLVGGSENDAVDESTDEHTSMHSHERENESDACIDKIVRLIFDVNVRLVYVPKHSSKSKADLKIREMFGAFKQFNLPHLNSFEIEKFDYGEEAVRKYRQRQVENGILMNNEELATLYHFPNLTVKTPNISWVRSRKLEPPVDLPLREESEKEGFTLLGRTNFRGSKVEFGIQDADRRRHVYIIGKTGMGKSTLLENMIYSDIMEGKGVGVVDPHGDLADMVLSFVPPNRTNDVVLIDPADRDFPVAFNMLENIDPSMNTIVCSGLIGIFKKIYAESWGPRLEHILRNTILSLLESQGATMLGVTRILQDDDFRKKIVAKITDPIVKSFWVNEFDKMQDKFRIEAISPILNKVGQFLSSPIIRNMVGQPKSSVDLRFAMDKGKIVIVNLSKGRIGEDNSSLLGAMIITKFQLDAMSRANQKEADRKDFYLYVDEFQNFATDSFSTILSEARKYKLNLTMANQYIAQMPEEVRDAVFGNVGTLVSMQVGFDDAEYISQQFGEEVLPPDLVGMSKYTAYMRLLIDNMPSKTFSMDTLPPPLGRVANEERSDIVRKVARERYSEKRSVVEEKIMRWSGVGEEALPTKSKSKK